MNRRTFLRGALAGLSVVATAGVVKFDKPGDGLALNNIAHPPRFYGPGIPEMLEWERFADPNAWYLDKDFDPGIQCRPFDDDGADLSECSLEQILLDIDEETNGQGIRIDPTRIVLVPKRYTLSQLVPRPWRTA